MEKFERFSEEKLTYLRALYRGDDLFRTWTWLLCLLEQQLNGLNAVEVWSETEMIRQKLSEIKEHRDNEVEFLYGELKNSRRIASALVKARTEKRIETTTDFIKAVEPLFKREREKKDMAKLFQALRIEVNHEMDALKEMLKSATEILKPGGRLSVITYHSLEDRIVKNVMKSGNSEGKITQDFFGRIETPFKLINNKVIIPDDEEQERNPRSRSAKLRIAEKK